MPSPPRLKTKVRAILRVVAIFYGIAIAWVVLGMPHEFGALSHISPPRVVLSSLTTLGMAVIGWIDRLAPSRLKELLVFWRIRDALPGHRAFETRTLKRDSRIDINNLKERFNGKFPGPPSQQNAAWYALYKKHSGEHVVQEIHMDYLLYRDLTWLTAVAATVSLVLSCLFVEQRTPLVVVGLVFVVLTALTSVVARNSANRFVTDVLTIESHTSSRKSKGRLL